MKLILRKFVPNDYKFIMSSWLRSTYKRNLLDGKDVSDHYAVVRKRIEKSFDDFDIQVLVDSEDREFIVGYVVLFNDIVIWKYIKQAYRKQRLSGLLNG